MYDLSYKVEYNTNKQTKKSLQIQRTDWRLPEVGDGSWEKWVEGVKGKKENE